MCQRELLDFESVGDGKPWLPAPTRGSAFAVEGRLGAQLGRGVARREVEKTLQVLKPSNDLREIILSRLPGKLAKDIFDVFRSGFHWYSGNERGCLMSRL